MNAKRFWKLFLGLGLPGLALYGAGRLQGPTGPLVVIGALLSAAALGVVVLYNVIEYPRWRRQRELPARRRSAW